MDLNKLTAVKSAQPTFPLNFSVTTEAENDRSPVLYIENIDNAHDLHWNIVNEGNTELFIEKLAGPPSVGNFHFQLRLRPGTLSRNFISIGTPIFRTNRSDASWEIHVTEDSISKIVYISLLATEIPAGKLVFTANEPFEVVIEKVNADPVGGARNTNVEFVYKSIFNGVDNALNGNRMQHLGIVNHQGVKNIPLLAQTLGSPIILNTGVRNDIGIEVFNYSRNMLPLLHEGDRRSTFEIIIDAPMGDESGESFLAPMDNLKEIELVWKDLVNWKADPRVENPNSVSWKITNEHMTGIDMGQALGFDLNNITTKFAEGVANIRINYFNFPGYWDGTLHFSLAKSPITFKDKNVGIHTNDPKHLLDVRGDGGFNKLVITKTDGTEYAGNGINMANNIPDDSNEYLQIKGIEGSDQKTRLALVAEVTKVLCSLLDIGGHLKVQDSLNNAVIYGPSKDAGQYHFRAGTEVDFTELMQIDRAGVVSAKEFRNANGPVVPSGIIVLWNGSAGNIPAGWALCDGNNNTPDLQEKFVYGTGNRGPAPGTKGGSPTQTLTADQLPPHSHNIDFKMGDVNATWSGQAYWPVNPVHRDNGSWTKATANAGGGKAFDIMPPFYALCYIMKL